MIRPFRKRIARSGGLMNPGGQEAIVEFSITYADDRFELRTSGMASAGEYEDLLAALTAHEKWQSGSLVLSDETTLETSHLDSRDIAEIANICGKFSDIIGKAKIAILAQADLVFGLNRMWEVYVEGQWEAKVLVFRSREEALEWLSS